LIVISPAAGVVVLASSFSIVLSVGAIVANDPESLAALALEAQLVPHPVSWTTEKNTR